MYFVLYCYENRSMNIFKIIWLLEIPSLKAYSQWSLMTTLSLSTFSLRVVPISPTILFLWTTLYTEIYQTVEYRIFKLFFTILPCTLTRIHYHSLANLIRCYKEDNISLSDSGEIVHKYAWSIYNNSMVNTREYLMYQSKWSYNKSYTMFH